VLSADTASARENPVLAAWGFDWYYVGQETARVMDRILKGESTADFPPTVIEDASHMKMILNTAVAEELGITFPAEDLERAELRAEL
jgi:putative ABC transport system substrate-binding protein